MNAGQVIEQNVPVHFTLRIAKVDKDTREVEGVCTQEVMDVHGEIVDHESMKAALLDWPGNIREMHQPIAVGKAVRVESDDTTKATILRARISKGAPDTWTKVEDGTLSMYSIGGTGRRVISKNADGSEEKRIFLHKLMEISLVDNGACPTAKFDVVKMVDGESTHVQPEDVEKAATPPAELPDREIVSDPLTLLETLCAKFTGEPRALAAAQLAMAAVSNDPSVEKRAYPTPYNIEQTLGAIALLERICAEEWWKAQETEAGDEDASTDKLQLQVLRNAIELVIAYLLSEFNAQFADLDAEAPTQRADTSAVDLMNVSIARRAELVEQAAFDLPMVFSKLDGTGQLWLAKAGARHSKSDIQMVQAMHDTAVTLGAVDCAMCATGTQQKTADIANPVAAADAVVLGKFASNVQAAVKTLNAAVARHQRHMDGSEKTSEASQQKLMAEMQSALQALDDEAVPAEKCAAAATEAIATEPVAQPAAAAAPVQEPGAPADTPIQHVAGMTEDDVHTFVKTAVDQALQTHKATSDQTIADLQAQITKLSNEPLPGGPKARATGTEGTTPVHKKLGESGSALEGIDPAAITAFAEQLAKDATPQERERIAMNLLKFQHTTGAGAVVVSQTVARRND